MSFQIATLEKKVFSGSGDKSILDEALNAGYVFEYSCKNGQCGVCKASLLSGEIKEIRPQLALTEQDALKKQFLTCCCAPTTDILIDSEDLSALHAIELKTLPARISQLQLLSDNIIEVKLRFPPTADFNFLEGQYVDVIHSSATRSYSVASTSEQKEMTLLIKKVDQGLLSAYWFEHAVVNDLLRIEGPKGTFFLRDKEKPLVFLATGTGIAPIMAILRQLDENKTFEQHQPIYLFWGNRNEEDFVWDPVFQRLRVESFRVLSKPRGNWREDVGYVQDVAVKKVNNLTGCHVYACGSNNMITSAKKLFMEKGLDESSFYSDAFVQSY